MGKKNYGKSVKTRLFNLMNETGYKYMYLLARYFNERLLYRVSVSQYKDNFLLKGGSLLYAMDGLNARPTIDVDFMAESISRDREFLTKVFKEILGIACDEDGVTFDTENITMEPITVEKKYPGTRFFFTAYMDSIIHKMSVDIGFGDVVTPYPASIDFPLLLPNILKGESHTDRRLSSQLPIIPFENIYRVIILSIDGIRFMTSNRSTKYSFNINTYLILHIDIYSIFYINFSCYICANIATNYIHLFTCRRNNSRIL